MPAGTRSRPPIRLALAGLLACLAGCGQGDPVPRVRLNGPVEAVSERRPAGPPLRFAVAAMISPRKAYEDYAALLQRVGEVVGRPVEIVSRNSYAEASGLLERREIDAIFMCSGPYVEAREKFGAELLAVPVVNGKKTYSSCIIVPEKSPASGFWDLKGKSFAFTDPDSNSGWLYPAFLLAGKGLAPGRFFSRTIFTGGHDGSVSAVAAGMVDGAAVDCLILDQMTSESPGIASRVRIIGRSPSFGIPPIVVHPALDPKLKELLRRAFLSLHQDEQGRALLRRARFDHFALQDDAAYDGIRRMLGQVEKAGK